MRESVSAPNVARDRFESMPATPYYIGIMLSGMATVLLGPILPLISARWMLTDAQSGSLFTAQFAASVVGASLSSYYRRFSVVFGYFAIAAGFALLSFSGYLGALLGLSLMGFGIGGSVTATNLIFGNEYPERRGQLLTRTNFCWGVGAVAAPQLIAVAEHHNALRFFLLAAAVCICAAGVVLAPILKAPNREFPQGREAVSNRIAPSVFILFSAMLFLYVGCETAIAGWVATYTHRLDALSLARSSMIVSVFWIALLGGRVLVPFLLRVYSELSVLLGGLIAALTGLLLFMTWHSPIITFVCVIIAGLGCAPVFPLITSALLARIGRSNRAGWIFAISGSGGAVIPWLTGLVSERSGSLNAAFSIPLAGVAAVLLCVLAERAVHRVQRSA